MKTFLIEYDRAERRLVDVRDFGDDREQAGRARLKAELKALAERRDMEIVTLEAESLDVLHRTHATYFGDIRQSIASEVEKLAS